MTLKIQTFTSASQSGLSKLVKLALNDQQKTNTGSKKLFSRKPLNSSQNSSRILSSRLKTQQSTDNDRQNEYQQNNSIENLIKQTKNIKFVSTKNSKSIQKLLISQSVQQLPSWQNPKKRKSLFNGVYNKSTNSKNNNQNQPSKITDHNKNIRKLDIIQDEENYKFQLKENIGSTEFSSNQNIGNQDQYQEQFRKPNGKSKDQILRRNQTSSFCLTRKSVLKECQNCFINLQKIKNLQQKNKQLTNSFEQKEEQIKRLNQRLERLQKYIKQKQVAKINFEYQIKLFKQKQILIINQKEEIQNSYRKLQINFNKISQEMRYKELENSINKVYKNKSHELESKVQCLKQELKKTKNKVHTLHASRSSESLRDRPSNKLNRWENSNKFIQNEKQSQQKKSKHPKVLKIYSEDSIFSLSQEEGQ